MYTSEYKLRIIETVINSVEAQEAIRQVSIAIAPALATLMQCIGQAIEEELSRQAEINESEACEARNDKERIY